MQVDGFLLNITSEQPDALREWYAEVLELPAAEGMAGGFNAGGTQITFDSHSGVTGKAAEPQRVLIDFLVSDLAAERERLLARGVEFIRDPEREGWGGLITTFLDPDGNYLQLIELPEEMR
jgi:predicted enzyme related to lactoylglutathione lyase